MTFGFAADLVIRIENWVAMAHGTCC